MTVQLSKDELRLAGVDPQAWPGLQFRQRRWYAAMILRRRRDKKSQFDAMQIEMANPNFNDFVLVGV